jgi:hypothetical protein
MMLDNNGYAAIRATIERGEPVSAADAQKLIEKLNEMARERERMDCQFAGLFNADFGGRHCPLDQPCERCKAVALQADLDKLRDIVARSSLPCLYCGLPANETKRCASGFPGCGRIDDMLLEG